MKVAHHPLWHIVDTANMAILANIHSELCNMYSHYMHYIKIEWRVHCIVWLNMIDDKDNDDNMAMITTTIMMRIMTATTMMMAMVMVMMMMTGTLHPIVDPPVVSARGVALVQAPQLSIFLSFYHYLAYSWLSIITSASIIILRIFSLFLPMPGVTRNYAQCSQWWL